MKLKYKDVNVIHDIPPITKGYVVIDVELFGAEKKLLHRPTGRFACITMTVSEDTVYLLTDKSQLKLALENIKDAVWVASNFMFDLRQMRRWAEIKPRKKIYDIETIERILFANYYKNFAVKDTARRYCDIVLDKDPVKDFYEATELTPELEEYAVLDGVAEYMILQEQLKVVKENKWAFDVWMKIDMPAMWAYLDFYGFRVDVDAWRDLYEYNLKETERLQKEFDFNPGSWQQTLEFFRENGFAGLPSTGEKVLLKWINKYPNTKAAEIAKDRINYLKIAKRSSTYGMNFIEDYIEEVDGVQVIFPDYNLSRAETGRESSRLHNIPAREAPEYRKPWIARPGNKLIVADWSSQEARGHAYYTQDPTLIKIFLDDLDVYAETYNLMYQANITKKDPERNDVGKPSFLGATYGQSKYGLSKQYNISLQEAEDIQNRFFKVFPKSKEWCDKQRKKNDYVETAMGRRYWLNPYKKFDNERNALNSPHQGLGADMKKLAISKIYFNWHFDCPFGMVHENHDEVILDVPEELADEIAEYVEYWMVKVGEDMCPGIPFKADAKVCDNWLQGK